MTTNNQLGQRYQTKRKLNTNPNAIKEILEWDYVLPVEDEVIQPTMTTSHEDLEGMLGIDKINPTDYIMFTKQDGSKFAVTIGLEYGGNDWYNQNKLALQSKRIVSDINEAMIMYREIVQSYVKNNDLYHPDTSKVKKEVIESLYKELTQDNWQNLNAIFEAKPNGIFLMKKAVGLDKKGELVYDSGMNVSSNFSNGSLIDLEDFDDHGFPKKVSGLNGFNKDKNIYFYNPVDKKVARLNSNAYSSVLLCNGGLDVSNASLGVRLSIAHWQG